MRRFARFRIAVAVVAFEGALAIAAGTLGRVAHKPSNIPVAVLILAFLAVGAVIALRVPGHPMGWILLGGSLFFLLSAVGSAYSVLDYREHHGTLPLGPVAVMIDPGWAPAIVCTVLGVLLYPDGRLPSRRWRGPVFGFLAVAAVWQFGAYTIALNAIIGGHISVAASGDLTQVDNPSGAWAWWSLVEVLNFLCLAALLVAWVIGQIAGYRELSGEQRLQQKWLLGGAVITVVGFLFTIPSGVSANPAPFLQELGNLSPVLFIALPVSIGIGILRFHLYDIDRLISRTLSYLIVTALLVATFVGLVALTTDLLAFSSSVGVAASTLAAAALLHPLRRRVQRAVDRRFNRSRYDAEATVAAFAARLRDAVDLDTVQTELLSVVARAVEPTHVTIWVRGRSE